MAAGRPDVPTLVGGLAVLALGVVLTLDSTGSLDLDFGSATPIVLAVLGIVLMASGLGARGRQESVDE